MTQDESRDKIAAIYRLARETLDATEAFHLTALLYYALENGAVRQGNEDGMTTLEIRDSMETTFRSQIQALRRKTTLKHGARQ